MANGAVQPHHSVPLGKKHNKSMSSNVDINFSFSGVRESSYFGVQPISVSVMWQAETILLFWINLVDAVGDQISAYCIPSRCLNDKTERVGPNVLALCSSTTYIKWNVTGKFSCSDLTPSTMFKWGDYMCILTNFAGNIFNSAWLCQQSSWKRNLSVRLSVASIISEVIAWISFKF